MHIGFRSIAIMLTLLSVVALALASLQYCCFEKISASKYRVLLLSSHYSRCIYKTMLRLQVKSKVSCSASVRKILFTNSTLSSWSTLDLFIVFPNIRTRFTCTLRHYTIIICNISINIRNIIVYDIIIHYIHVRTVLRDFECT